MAVVDAEERTQALEEQISRLSDERNKIQENAVQLLGQDVELAKNFFAQFWSGGWIKIHLLGKTNDSHESLACESFAIHSYVRCA